MRELIKLTRPHQWMKNFFCLAGVFFGGHFHEWPLVLKGLLVFVGFCALSGAVYVFNDIHDREEDARHARKRNRPLVKGTVSVPAASLLSGALLVVGFGVLWPLGETFPAVATVAGMYAALNVAYTLRLKKVPLIDVNVIALGFVLRVAAGAFAIDITPTRWILLCTYFLALLLAFGKRRAELFADLGEAAAGGNGTERNERGRARGGRVALEGYTLEVLDIGLVVCAVLVIATYGLYCMFAHETVLIVLTVVPVAIGTMRYLMLAREGSRAEAPELLLIKDRLLLMDVLVWAGLFAWVLYGMRIS